MKKISILGEQGCGKTTYIQSLLKDSDIFILPTTLGDISFKFTDNTLEDDTHGCIILFDLTIKDSHKYALQLADELSQILPVVLAGTKVDSDERVNNILNVDKRAREYSYYAISSNIKFNITKPLLMLMKQMISS